MYGTLVTLTASGMRCPASGQYQSQTGLPKLIELIEGQAVPLHQGKIAYWKLVTSAQSTVH